MYLFPGRMCVPSTLSLDSRKSQQRRMPTLPLPCFTGTVKTRFPLALHDSCNTSNRRFNALVFVPAEDVFSLYDQVQSLASSHYSMSISLYWWLLVSFRIHYEAFHFKTSVGGQQGPEVVGEEQETSEGSVGFQELHREHLCWQDGPCWQEH